MSIEAITEAGAGWSKILGRKSDWDRHFRFDAEAMNLGFVVYGVGVLIAIVLATFRIGFPPPEAMLLIVIGHLLPLVALVLSTAIVTRFALYKDSSAKFIVPGLYILALMKIIEGLAILIGVPLAGAILAIIGILGFHLARANGLPIPAAIGYGLVLFTLLAGLPIAIYMLLNAL